LVIVVSPEGGDESFAAVVERVTQFIKDHGGEVTNTDQWGRRKLAYPISRFAEGFYAVTHFKFEPREVRALEDSLTRSEDVLRHLVTRRDEVSVASRKESKDGGPE
jgi:small subunit ribosomal protein S6